MAFKALPEQQKVFLTVVVLLGCLACTVLCETGDCGQQEFRDRSGNCALCQQCGPGMELSKVIVGRLGTCRSMSFNSVLFN